MAIMQRMEHYHKNQSIYATIKLTLSVNKRNPLNQTKIFESKCKKKIK